MSEEIEPKKILSRVLPPSCPREGVLRIKAKLSGTPKKWATSLSGTGFGKLSIRKSALHASYIKSLDLQKNPHDYINLIFSKNSIEATYSLPSPNSAALREIEALRLIFLCLCAMGQSTLTPQLSAATSNSLQSAISLIPKSVAELSAKNEELESAVAAQEERIRALHDEREKMARRSLEEARRLQSISSRLDSLLHLPDSFIDEAALEWLLSHGGQISISEFCSAHKVAPARAEESLDRLCKTGKIARVQK
ncbi:hypothetical protein COU37_05845 [Candidatus Micrarchaeota archaeon CG10_big_fil_rev_8_21_14_0_10_45_29]|nr:MAG: hypothetical protein COU37_05845 [Candidatus Micrarchaeota archaeon CG10_big_fil_rev_8_21_14_0_10_45_29]